MLTCSAVALRRLVGRSSRTTAASPTIRSIVTSLTPTEIKAEDENDKLRNMLEDEKSDVQKYVESMRGEQVPGRKTVWSNLKPLPDPVLPDNPSEIAALDSVQSEMDSVMPDGRRRIVSIRQMDARVTQAPTDTEKRWIISFSDDGEAAETWNNPLMGWVSGADPPPSITLQMDFDNAAAAVYFAKKRGWKYIVEEPIYRYEGATTPNIRTTSSPRLSCRRFPWRGRSATTGTARYPGLRTTPARSNSMGTER